MNSTRTRKISTVVAALGVTWALSACGGTTTRVEIPQNAAPAPAPVQKQSKPKVDMREVALASIRYAFHQSSDQAVVCYGVSAAPDLVADAFRSGGGSTFDILSDREILREFQSLCADRV